MDLYKVYNDDAVNIEKLKKNEARLLLEIVQR